MRVNELFGFSIVSSNYVLTNHTYNMYKQTLALNNIERLNAIKTNQPTNQPTNIQIIYYQQGLE